MKITIKKPCHENWNEMLPETKGRFCLKCAKTVVDFSLKSTDEIKLFFKEKTEKVCGRFALNQVEKTKNHNFSYLNKRIVKFTIALYLVFGGFLFTSCSNKTETLGEPTVEHVKGDTTQENREFTVGKITKLDTLKVESPEKKSSYLKRNIQKCTKSIKADTIFSKPTIEQTLKGDVMIEY